jgi:glycosyltransferase involved in cell wall biosynthesis
MKLLVVSESPLVKIGSDYFAADPWILIAINFANSGEHVTLWVPIDDRLEGSPVPEGHWKVHPGSMRIVPQDFYNSFASYFKLWPFRRRSWGRRIEELSAEHDAIISRVPSPILPIVTTAARRLRRPLVLFVVGDMQTQSDTLRSSRGLRWLFYAAAVRFFMRQEVRCSQSASLVYVYSRDLACRFGAPRPEVKQVQDPHLRLTDFFERTDTCLGSVIRLLRVSWLLPSKGIDHLIRAIAQVKGDHRNVILEIVGQERVPGYQRELERVAASHGISDKVKFLGWMPHDRIAEAFKRSDIQILSSLAEGTPRVMVEGFARGLPLISTSVGGCADLLKHEENALIVPPADPTAIAHSIDRLILDSTLRTTLIRGGYETARAATFDVAGPRFKDDIRSVLMAALPIAD